MAAPHVPDHGAGGDRRAELFDTRDVLGDRRG